MQTIQELAPVALVCLSLFIIVMFLAHLLWQFMCAKDIEIANMTDADLLFESLYAAEGGDYPNEYSRELERRQVAKVPA